MNQKQLPRRFYHNELCEALCGYTKDELKVQMRNTPHIGPIGFHLLLKEIDVDEVYCAFKEFRSFETEMHPRHECPEYRSYDLSYTTIEMAYAEKRAELFKSGMRGLLLLVLESKT